MSSNWFDDAQKQIDEMTPDKGYNVVAVDSMEEPGHALYFVEHCDDQAEAERARRAHASKTGDRTYVYGPKQTNHEASHTQEGESKNGKEVPNDPFGTDTRRADEFNEVDHPRDQGGKFAPKGAETLKREKVAKMKATKMANAAKLKAELGTTAFNKQQGAKKAAANEKRRAAQLANAAAKAQAKEEARKRALQGKEAYKEHLQAGVDYANQVVANRGKPMSMEENAYQERAYAARERAELAQKLTHEGVGEYENSKENKYGYEPSDERAKLEAEQARERDKNQLKIPDQELTANAAADHARIERELRINAKMGEHARPEHEVREEVQRHIAEERQAKFEAEQQRAAAEAKMAAARAEREAKAAEAKENLARAAKERDKADDEAIAAQAREKKAREEWERVGKAEDADTAKAKGALRELQAARREANAAADAQLQAEKAHSEALAAHNALSPQIIERDSNSRDLLADRKIVDIKPLGGGVSESWKVTLDDGSKAVWKSGDPNAEEAPDREHGKLRDNIDAGGYYIRNAAASAVAPLLGVGDLVPATVVHDPTGSPASGIGSEHNPDHPGSLQAWAEGTRMVYNTPITFDQAAAERMRAADFVLGSTDRHGKNVMVMEKDGKNYPIMIDNDLCLPKGTGDRFIQPMDNIPFGSLMDSTKAMIKGYDHVAIARSLHHSGIEPEAVKLAVVRAERIRKNPDVLENRYGANYKWQSAANARPTSDEMSYADRVYADAVGGK